MKTLNFNQPFFIVIGNNGNHTGINRIWDVCSYGYPTKIAAINEQRNITANNGDIKYGLTPCRVVSATELSEMIQSEERVNYLNCFDIN